MGQRDEEGMRKPELGPRVWGQGIVYTCAHTPRHSAFGVVEMSQASPSRNRDLSIHRGNGEGHVRGTDKGI